MASQEQVAEHVPLGRLGRPGGEMITREYLLTGPGRGALATGAVDDPGPGQLLIKIAHNGVCASEVEPWATGPQGSTMRFGHEPIGTVAACGPGAAIPEGTWITGRVEPTYADFAIADARDVVAVPAGVAVDVALGEPVGCVVDGLGRTPLHLADRVVVIGAGFMGRIAIQLLVRSWAAHVTVVDLREDARRGALADGADAAHDPGELPAGAAGGADVVIEATGSQAGLDLATDLVREHGVVSILGYHQSSRAVDMKTWNWKALTVVNAHVRDRHQLQESIRRGLELVACGRLDLGGLITHRFTFDRIDDAFRTLHEKPPGFVKAMIDIA